MSSSASTSHVSGIRPSHWLREEWAPVLFVVALVTVLHHSALSPVSRVSLLLLSWAQVVIGSPSAPSSANIWLLSIDEAEFETRYRERRPLDRCVLHHDLKVILDAHPKVLVIDLDLSPAPDVSPARTAESASAPHGGAPEADACQVRLNDLLDTFSSESKVVLMRPFGVQNFDLREKKTDWMRARKRVYFADPEIDIGGIVTAAIEFECNPNGLAETALAAQSAEPCVRMKQGQFLPLDYVLFKANVFEQSAESLGTDPNKLQSMKDKTIFFGSRFGRADAVATPLGSSHGVVVHATRFATLQRQETQRPLDRAAWNFVIDLVMAGWFSWLIAGFMHRYLETAKVNAEATPPRLTAMLARFVLTYLGVVLLVMVGALGLAVMWGLITEPLLIAFGLAIDGFVIAAWAHVGKGNNGDEGEEQDQEKGKPWWPSRFAEICRTNALAALVELVRWAIFWAVVLRALVSTFSGSH